MCHKNEINKRIISINIKHGNVRKGLYKVFNKDSEICTLKLYNNEV